jgi:UDP-N-acetylglucosamine kinase
MTTLTLDEQKVQEDALNFARKNKKPIARALTDPTIFVPELNPVSVFMAGSPGAGKTESSKELLAVLESKDPKARILRVDPDDLRCQFPSYTGKNSYLFQGAISIIVGRILDLAHAQRQSFLLDGTLSNLKQARENVLRCLKSKRPVQILYVYQDPLQAWKFVQAREAEEGRNVPVGRFIEQYFAARDVVNALKTEFGTDIMVDLLVKPNDSVGRLYKAGIDQIDNHVKEKYDRVGLARVLAGDQE